MPNSVHNSFMRRKSLAAWYIHAAHNCEKKRERNSLKCAELFQKKKKKKISPGFPRKRFSKCPTCFSVSGRVGVWGGPSGWVGKGVEMFNDSRN